MSELAPWQKGVSEINKAKSAYLILESIRIMSIFLFPVLPQYIPKVYQVLNI